MTFSYKEAFEDSLKYFKGDDLAANVAVTKYLLTDTDGSYLETTPHKMHQRLAREFHRIEMFNELTRVVVAE